jgi:hypothetical protein
MYSFQNAINERKAWLPNDFLLSGREIHRHHAHDYLKNPSETVVD